MTRIMAAFLSAFAVSMPAVGADPCAVLGYGNSVGNGCQGISVSSKYGLPVPGGLPKKWDFELLAEIIAENRKLRSEVSTLRTELKTAVDGLAEAVSNLQAISLELKKGNDNWQQHTLQQTINSINTMPAELGKSEALQAVVTAGMKEKLPNDAEFVQRIAEQIKSAQ